MATKNKKQNLDELIQNRDNLQYELARYQGHIAGYVCYKNDLQHQIKVNIIWSAICLFIALCLIAGGWLGAKYINMYWYICILFSGAPLCFCGDLALEAAIDNERIKEATNIVKETEDRYNATMIMYKEACDKVEEAEKKNGKRTKTTKTTNK